MATQYAFGKISNNGLVLAWDVADRNSYPGSGTTIYDVSRNGNNGTLTNGVGYSITSTGPVLTFDGVDDYVTSTTPNLASTNYTVIGAARYSGATRGRIINSANNNWLLGHWNNSVANYYAEGWVSPAAATGGTDTNWRIYAGTGNIGGGSYSFYINNTLNAGPNAGGSQGPNGITVGAQGGGGTERSTAEFSFVLVYNRILTTDEITQIYNSKKSRFNL